MISLALNPVYALLEECLRYGGSVALQAAAGKFLCAEGGGPEDDKAEFLLTARSDAGPWETWRLHRGKF